MNKIKHYMLEEREETRILLRNIPATVVTLFVVSVISMNLLANKTLYQNEWIAIDGGILISWLSFMCMDIITKYFGAGASNRIAVLASLINVFTCVVFLGASLIPSNADNYEALNEILGGTWFILFGSTVAFLSSAAINNGLNHTIGKVFSARKDGRLAYAVSCYVSTFVGQFFDNFIFSVIVFAFFAPRFWDGFCWTIRQCAMCAFTGAVAELLMEVLFSPIGYRIIARWKRYSVGQEYLNYIRKRRES